MRSTVVFLILAAMSGLFVVLQVTRKPTPHRSSLAPAPAPPRAVATKGAAAKGGAKKAIASAPKKKAAPEKPPPPRMTRPLRVASLGWELIAPGVVANGGAEPGKTSAFKKERLEVHLAAFPKLDELEAALARGGADPNGADVAILPLPELCASYERLRALAPQVFLVLGWSRGRDGLLAAKEELLQRPPRAGRVELAAERGSSPAFLALFLLEAAGVAPKRVSLVDPAALLGRAASRPAGPARRPPAFAALERPLPASAKLGDHKFVATTADARRLIPIVAVAPSGLLASHGEALSAWGQVWLGGVAELERDVPAAARQVSALKLAPPAIELLGRLGGIEAASLAENARLFGLSGRDPVSLEELFRRSWSLWRASGLLTSPPPERAPVAGDAVAAMVRTYPTLVEAAPPPAARPRAGGAAPTRPGERLLSHAPAVRKPAEALPPLAFLAAVFDRSTLKVSWRESLSQARALVASASERFDLPRPERLQAAAHKDGPTVTIEVAAP